MQQGGEPVNPTSKPRRDVDDQGEDERHSKAGERLRGCELHRQESSRMRLARRCG